MIPAWERNYNVVIILNVTIYHYKDIRSYCLALSSCHQTFGLTEQTEYLSSEAEESLGFDHLFQHVTLDASCAVILIHHSVLQVDVIYCQTDMVLLPVDDGYSVEFVHHL